MVPGMGGGGDHRRPSCKRRQGAGECGVLARLIVRIEEGLCNFFFNPNSIFLTSDAISRADVSGRTRIRRRRRHRRPAQRRRILLAEDRP